MVEVRRKRYTREFKRDAVRLVTDQGRTIAEAAHRLSVNANMLGRWKHESTKYGSRAFTGKG